MHKTPQSVGKTWWYKREIKFCNSPQTRNLFDRYQINISKLNTYSRKRNSNLKLNFNNKTHASHITD